MESTRFRMRLIGKRVPCGFSLCRRWGCLLIIDEFFVIIQILREFLIIISPCRCWLSGYSILHEDVCTVAVLSAAAAAGSWVMAKERMEAMISKDMNLVIFIYIITDGVKLVIVNIFV